MRRTRLLALAVGIVLADSAIVTLALPQILRELGGTVTGVAYVLISFNAVLALAAVPAARLCQRRDPAPYAAVGLVVFAIASAGCALAPSMNVLIAARVVQAVGGALVVVACLELLVASTGSEPAGVRRWIAAGVIGTATGPVIGGLLTEAISWQSIFIAQVPLVLLAVPAALSLRLRPRDTPQAGPRGADAGVEQDKGERPDVAANLALGLVSAALTAALFLVVLLLVEGYRRSPATAALAVSVVPLAALAARPLARLARAGARSEIVAGTLLVAGGLAALAYLPDARLFWTVAPQALVGLGLGLTVDALTLAALQSRGPRVRHGGWTIAARHAGVVLGLALLTPVFTADLQQAQVPAQESIAALVLDAQLPPQTKIDLAVGLADRLSKESGRVPDLHPAFAGLRLGVIDQIVADRLEGQLDDQLERAATQAFRNSFLLAAGLGLLALPFLLPLPGRRW